MRARNALLLAFAPFALACEGVPDLNFPSAEDASTSTVPPPKLDASSTVPGVDASSTGTPPSMDAGTDAGSVMDAGSTAPPPDASLSTDSGTSGCPDNPPAGTTCCGSVACKGTAQQCNQQQCNFCESCASEGFCCPGQQRFGGGGGGMCATSLSDCH